MKFVRWLWSDPDTMRPVGGTFDLTDQEAHELFVREINPEDQKIVTASSLPSKVSQWERLAFIICIARQ